MDEKSIGRIGLEIANNVMISGSKSEQVSLFKLVMAGLAKGEIIFQEVPTPPEEENHSVKET